MIRGDDDERVLRRAESIQSAEKTSERIVFEGNAAVVLGDQVSAFRGGGCSVRHLANETVHQRLNLEPGDPSRKETPELCRWNVRCVRVHEVDEKKERVR